MCAALQLWSAFTGCGTVSSFGSPTYISSKNFALLQRYVVMLYDKSSSLEDVDECRQVLITKKSRSIDGIPTTKAALFQHT